MTLEESLIGHIAEGVLDCKTCKVLQKLSGGLTNTSYLVDVDNVKYVFRLPGNRTEEIINRKHEKKALELARELNIDSSYITMNSIHGWKISRYIDNCYKPDYTDWEDSKLVIKKIKELHNKKAHVNWSFDPIKDVKIMEEKVSNLDLELKDKIQKIYESIKDDEIEKCFCHCDTYAPNFLINKDTKEVILIDWEYAGESDPAVDVTYYIVDAEYNFEEAIEFIKEYLQSEDEKLIKHYLAYIPIIAYYWYVWGMYRESCGSAIGEPIDNWKYMADKYSHYYLSDIV